MLQVEPIIAESVFFKSIENRTLAHVVTGSFAGATAAVVTFPVAAFKDYLLINTTINTMGLLENKNGQQAIRELLAQVSASPRQEFSKLNCLFWKTMPLRTAATAVVFASMAGIDECLGKEPLNRPYKMLVGS